ncbi:MAG TPA: hypothetical protein VGR57_09995 [Ktedonobacterales bacterium]|nr:hypothetical protein [Ktedonobacterales bacterium]
MEPEEGLDALLSQRQSLDLTPSGAAAPNDASDAWHAWAANGATAGDSTMLGPLVAAADAFAVWGTAEPSASFADRLEADLLARVAQPAEAGSAGATLEPGASSSESVRSQSQGAIQEGDAVSADRRTPGSPGRTLAAPLRLFGRAPGRERRRATRLQVLQRALVAAAVLVAAGGTLAISAATASPGQPLYGVLRFEQGVRTGLTNSPEERIRLQLGYAQDALAAYETAIAQQSGDPAYRDALATFLGDEQAATADIAALPESSARNRLTAQLMTLRTRGQAVLHASLRELSWAMRTVVTTTLAELGDDVPQIAQVTVNGVSYNGAYTWTIAVDGADFAPGAVLLVDGHPLGSVVSLSPTRLVAEVPSGQLSNGAHVFGVGNADGTASMATGVVTTSVPDDHGGHGDHGTPGAQSTPGGDDHGGSHGSGSGSGG